MLAYSATSGATTNTFVPLTDALGSTLGLVNAAGSLATQYSYEPFGVPTASGQSSNYPYLFAGMEYDTATGLYHTPARYYSPRLQRFLSEDPLQFGGGDVNLFAYAGNDPVNLVDPSGLQYCAYAFAGDFGSIGSGLLDLGNFASAIAAGQLADFSGGMVAALATAIGSVGIGGPGAATGVGGAARPTGASTLGAMGISSGQIVLAQTPDSGDLLEARYSVNLPPGSDSDLGYSIAPVPLELGPMVGIARETEEALGSRAARRMEQRWFRTLAKDLGVDPASDAGERLHDLVHEITKEGRYANMKFKQAYTQILEEARSLLGLKKAP